MEALPGLNDSTQLANTIEGDNELHELSIAQGFEWKIEVSNDAPLTVEVKSGIAEIFGTELATDKEYVFKNYKFSIYCVEDVVLSWRCSALNENNLSITANTTAKYVYNLHFALEKMRSSSFDGPRILVLGSQDSGKTALCRTLCSYAIKFKAYQPLYVNLNPTQAVFSPPGCVAAVPISAILDVQCSTWGQSMTSGATQLHSKQPIVKNFGLENISENKPLYFEMIDQLASNITDRLRNDSLVRRSGSIIDTSPLNELDEDFSDLEHIAKQFKINAAVILGEYQQDFLQRISQKLSQFIGVHLVNLPTLSGAIKLDDIYRRSLQRSAIREYFYGTDTTVLSPYAVGVDYQDIAAWKPKNFLENQDLDSDLSPTELSPVEIDPSNIQHALVAISYAPKRSPSADVIKAPLLGFALVTEVNEKRRKVRILVPVPGNLPSKALILTSYKYLE